MWGAQVLVHHFGTTKPFYPTNEKYLRENTKEALFYLTVWKITLFTKLCRDCLYFFLLNEFSNLSKMSHINFLCTFIVTNVSARKRKRKILGGRKRFLRERKTEIKKEKVNQFQLIITSTKKDVRHYVNGSVLFDSVIT